MNISNLFLCLFLLSLSWESLQSPSRVPQSQGATQHLFWLASGTEGCPSAIIWKKKSCNGFELKDTEEKITVSFCEINKPKKVQNLKSQIGSKKIISYSLREDNVIRKVEETVMREKQTEVSLVNEDMVILDDTGKFLWERSHNGKGFSCLYSI